MGEAQSGGDGTSAAPARAPEPRPLDTPMGEVEIIEFKIEPKPRQLASRQRAANDPRELRRQQRLAQLQGGSAAPAAAAAPAAVPPAAPAPAVAEPPATAAATPAAAEAAPVAADLVTGTADVAGTAAADATPEVPVVDAPAPDAGGDDRGTPGPQ